MKIKVIIALMLSAIYPFAYADIALIDEGNARLIRQTDDGLINSFTCPKYLNFSSMNIEDVRTSCNIASYPKRLIHMETDIFESRKIAFNQNLILNDELLKTKTEKQASLQEYDRLYGLDEEGKKSLKLITNEISKHYIELDKKNKFDKTAQVVLAELYNPSSQNIVVFQEKSEIIFKFFNFTENGLHCGNDKDIENGIVDCSIYPFLSNGKFTLFSLKVNLQAKLINQTADTVSGYAKFEYKDQLWRNLITSELEEYPKALNKKLNFTTSKLNTHIKFESEIINKKSGEIIRGMLQEGVFILSLVDADKEQVLLQKNMTELPTNFLIDKFKKNRYAKVKRIVDGQITLNDGLLAGLDMGYIFLFPIPIAAHAVYSLAYIPTFVYDIFSVDNIAHKKYKSFLKGNKKIKVSKKIFNKILQNIKSELN